MGFCRLLIYLCFIFATLTSLALGNDDSYASYDGYYEEDSYEGSEENEAQMDAYESLDWKGVAKSGLTLQFADPSIRDYPTARVIPPIIDDEYINMTEIIFSCRPSVEKRKEREEIREAARRKRIQEDEAASRRHAIQNKLGHRMQKKEREAAFAQIDEVDSGDFLVFGMDADLTNFSSFESSDELINATQSKANSTKAPKLSFRKAYELRIKHQLNENSLRESKFMKADLGPNCEELTCIACKTFVDEMITLIRNILSDAEGVDKYRHVTDVLRLSDICNSDYLELNYKPLVAMLCSEYLLNTSSPYYSHILNTLQEVQFWDENSFGKEDVFNLKSKVCAPIGACYESQFDIRLSPTNSIEDKWSDKCFVCRAYAKELEEQASISARIDDKAIESLITKTCNQLSLAPRHHAMCVSIYNNKVRWMKLTWILRVFAENTGRQRKAEKTFVDNVCTTLDQCTP